MTTDSSETSDIGQHPLDAALALQAQQAGHYTGSTQPSYWNMVGPYGGTTAALMLQAVLQHPDCLGEPVALTVNFAGPVAEGAFSVQATPVRTNRSTQHWSVQLGQTNAAGAWEVSTTATAVTAVRRDTFEADEVSPPHMPNPATCERLDTSGGMPWLARYDMRVVSGAVPRVWDDSEHEPLTQLWVRDNPPRALDYPALTALCDVFYPRVWRRRARRVPAGTVSMTVYFHADAAQLQAHGDAHVLGQAGAQAFRHGFFDQTAQIWDCAGRLLATSHQTVYYKA